MQEAFIFFDGIGKYIRALDKYKVRYVVIGGYALRFHGHLRGVKDLDILIDNSLENAEKVNQVLTELRGSESTCPVERLTKPRQQIRFEDLEILTSIDGIDFEEVYDNSPTEYTRGLDIPIASVEHLLKIKRISYNDDQSREKDLEDIKYLESI
jgi:hypothetical protein